MADVFSKSKRSEVMSKIRSKNTKLDVAMKATLQRARIPHRSYPKIYGNPDFLIKKNVVLFCDSSFWHGKNWNKLKKKLENGNNPQYWVIHIQKNRKRDRFVTSYLSQKGYRVIRFWDKDIFKRPEWCVEQIKKCI